MHAGARRSDRGHNPAMTAAELARSATELGLDVVGAAPAVPYEETEQQSSIAATRVSLPT